jgi:hypothetical protein
MSRRVLRTAVVLALLIVGAGAVLPAATGGGLSLINRDDLREWLSYIASDDLEGRALYSTGLGLAAGYLERHVRDWGARPAGDAGSYLQTVKVLGVKATSRSTVTVEVGGQRRTFTDGEGVFFPRKIGSRRRFTVSRVEFAGYGLDAPRSRHIDLGSRDVRGAVVVWLGERGPKDVDPVTYRALLAGRSQYATDQLGALAGIGPPAPADASTRGDNGADAAASGKQRNPPPAADFTTTERLDLPEAPNVRGSDAFFELLFSRAPVKYAELKRRSDAREPLPSFRLDGVTLTFNLATDYQVVRTQIAHNVVAVVEGSDPDLRNTYVAFGAHYDHVGYADGELTGEGAAAERRGVPQFAFTRPGADQDRVWNGADDDGSGTVALLAMVKAFAQGPRPKRSLLFVWHTGEEEGRLGSLYYADHPTVPLTGVMAQLNIDMIGRNHNDNALERDTVYLVGSDRISTELDSVSRTANDALPAPLTLNYELNDPGDPEQLYFRSDHYSYAAKGIPVIFFTTGLHPDYHMNSDEVSKIEFDKMTRIVQLVYETGWRLANLDHPLVRDNKGAVAQ